MAYDEELADRIRAIVAEKTPFSEQRMFGGLAFLVGGHMSIAAANGGGLLVRCEPEQTDDLLREAHAEPFVMRGRTMEGWLRVTPEGVRSDDELRRWAERAVGYALSLPPKGGR